MSRALLLSPDDQAVSAITGVLEEISVSCERPLDGASAALKLNSHNFDLVLVDCENLPAAKLIFDVCRRGKSGNTPVPIAIVDGRSGLPTAFRLGADLILTKPVSKDNARTTIRTAMGRVKKEEPARAAPVEDASSTAPAVAQEKAMAAAAGVASVPATAPPPAAKDPEPASVIKAETAAPAPQMSPAVKETPASKILFSSEVAPSRVVKRPLEILPGLKAEPEDKLQDDPVLAEIDKTENEVVAAPVAVTPKTSGTPAKAVAKKSSGPVVLLALILAGGGCYAAWMYSPAFRAMAGPQIDHVMALAGPKEATMPHMQAKVPAPAPATPKAPASAPQSASVNPTPAPANVSAGVPSSATTNPEPAVPNKGSSASTTAKMPTVA